MAITIDSAGRVVIPQAVRRRLGLTGGSLLEVDEIDGAVVLRPAATVRVEDGADGLPVLRAPDDAAPMSAADVRRLIEEGREWAPS